MRLVEIQFDRVFDIKPVPWGIEAKTAFSFESLGRRYLSATVPGKPSIKDGQRVLAVVSREGDLKGLLAWKDLETGELAFNGPGWPLATVLMYLPIKLVLLFGVLRGESLFWLAGLLGFVVLDVMLIRDARDRLRVKALLEHG